MYLERLVEWRGCAALAVVKGAMGRNVCTEWLDGVATAWCGRMVERKRMGAELPGKYTLHTYSARSTVVAAR